MLCSKEKNSSINHPWDGKSETLVKLHALWPWRKLISEPPRGDSIFSHAPAFPSFLVFWPCAAKPPSCPSSLTGLLSSSEQKGELGTGQWEGRGEEGRHLFLLAGRCCNNLATKCSLGAQKCTNTSVNVQNISWGSWGNHFSLWLPSVATLQSSILVVVREGWLPSCELRFKPKEINRHQVTYNLETEITPSREDILPPKDCVTRGCRHTQLCSDTSLAATGPGVLSLLCKPLCDPVQNIKTDSACVEYNVYWSHIYSLLRNRKGWGFRGSNQQIQ